MFSKIVVDNREVFPRNVKLVKFKLISRPLIRSVVDKPVR